MQVVGRREVDDVDPLVGQHRLEARVGVRQVLGARLLGRALGGRADDPGDLDAEAPQRFDVHDADEAGPRDGRANVPQCLQGAEPTRAAPRRAAAGGSALCDTLCDVASHRVSRSEARRLIIAATGRVLADRHFRDLTVEDVMAEAGLARTIFYRHFEGLPDLVLAALDDAVAEEPAPSADLHEMLERAVTLFARHGRLLVAVEEAAHHDAEVEQAYRDAFERSVDATAALAPRPVARALMHLNASYLTDALARSSAPNPDEALRTLELIWSRVLGISAPPARSIGA